MLNSIICIKIFNMLNLHVTLLQDNFAIFKSNLLGLLIFSLGKIDNMPCVTVWKKG
jgi:hypothetical protein